MERGLHGEMQDTNAGKWRGSQQAERVRVGSRLHWSAFLEARRMKGTLLFRVVALAGLASAALFVAQSASAAQIIPFDTTTLLDPRNAYTFNSPVDLRREIEITNNTGASETIGTFTADVSVQYVRG